MSGGNIRCIFFDVGNVLLRVDHDRFGEKMKLLAGLGLERLQQVFSDGLVSEYGLGHLNNDEFLAGINRKLGLRLRLDEFSEAWNCVFEDALLVQEDLLQALALKYPLWAVSNTNPMHFSFIREHFHFLDHFRGWTLSSDVGFEKPDPGIFECALNKAQVNASEVLFIDDLLENVEAARSLGMNSFQFMNSTQLIQEFQARRLL
jgi:glucose-1-phosphatase